MFIYGRGRVFINGKPMERIGYESVDELPFGKIRGIERMRCSQMPLAVMHYVDAFEVDCFGVMIRVGARRVRSERPPPPDG